MPVPELVLCVVANAGRDNPSFIVVWTRSRWDRGHQIIDVVGAVVLFNKCHESFDQSRVAGRKVVTFFLVVHNVEHLNVRYSGAPRRAGRGAGDDASAVWGRVRAFVWQAIVKPGIGLATTSHLEHKIRHHFNLNSYNDLVVSGNDDVLSNSIADRVSITACPLAWCRRRVGTFNVDEHVVSSTLSALAKYGPLVDAVKGVSVLVDGCSEGGSHQRRQPVGNMHQFVTCGSLERWMKHAAIDKASA